MRMNVVSYFYFLPPQITQISTNYFIIQSVLIRVICGENEIKIRNNIHTQIYENQAIPQTSMDDDATEQTLYVHLCSRYGPVDSLYHGAIHYLLCEVRSRLSGV
jgi:hypothetical protein